MKLLVLLSCFGMTTWADTFEYKLTGMTCSGCKKMIKSAICELPGIKECHVDIGSMKLTAEDGKTLDQKAISSALDSLNKKYDSEYKISQATEVKNQTNDVNTADKK